MPVLNKPNGTDPCVSSGLPAEIFIARVGSGSFWNSFFFSELLKYFLGQISSLPCDVVSPDVLGSVNVKRKHNFSGTLTINYSALNNLILFNITVVSLLKKCRNLILETSLFYLGKPTAYFCCKCSVYVSAYISDRRSFGVILPSIHRQ